MIFDLKRLEKYIPFNYFRSLHETHLNFNDSGELELEVFVDKDLPITIKIDANHFLQMANGIRSFEIKPEPEPEPEIKQVYCTNCQWNTHQNSTRCGWINPFTNCEETELKILSTRNVDGNCQQYKEKQLTENKEPCKKGCKVCKYAN